MKNLTTAAILMFLISFSNVSIPAQKSKTSNGNVRLEKNLVKFAGIEAYTEGRGVWLRWQTEIETKNLGFQVYRISFGRKHLVSPSLIAGAYLQASEEKMTSSSYSFFDAGGNANSLYVVESLQINGEKHSSPMIYPQTIPNLELVAGNTLEELRREAAGKKPFIYGEESILPKELAAEVQNFNIPANFTTQQWVAAQPGVRIGVKIDGFYRVSRAELEAAGFNVNAPANLWQLYANGIEQAITVVGNGDFIEFYGKGIDREESDTQIYFLVVGAQNGKRIGTAIIRPLNSSVVTNNYAQTFIKKERFIYSSGILNGDGHNFFGTVINSNGGTVSFNLTGIDYSAAASAVELTVQGLTQSPHQVRVLLNGTELGIINGGFTSSVTRRFEIPTSLLQEGTNTLLMTSLNGSQDISLFDTVKVEYARKYRAEQNKISFWVPNYKASYVENFSSPNIRVYDLTNPNAPVQAVNLRVEQNGASFRVYLPANRGRVLYALENSALLTPASITFNTPSTLSTANHNGRIVIISHKNWMTEANNWANYRRGQGFDVVLTNIEDILDEFNYGIFSTDAIKNFLQFAKNNWQVAPDYALIIGDATYDPRNFVGAGANNFVPTKMVDTVYMQTGSDEALADFNDDGLAEIPIGRIPVVNAPTVTQVLNKVSTFEQNVSQNLSRGALFASDLPDGYDFAGMSNRLRNQLPQGVPSVMVNRSAPDANAQLVSEMNNGRFLINYAGHGNTISWATNGFFHVSHASQLTNANNLSVFSMLTCLNGFFIQPTESIAEVLLKNPNGGAVAAWASTGLTTPDVQEIMATRYFNQVGAGNITRMGDLIKDAKTTIQFGRDVRLSWVLLGDPALKVR